MHAAHSAGQIVHYALCVKRFLPNTKARPAVTSIHNKCAKTINPRHSDIFLPWERISGAVRRIDSGKRAEILTVKIRVVVVIITVRSNLSTPVSPLPLPPSWGVRPKWLQQPSHANGLRIQYYRIQIRGLGRLQLVNLDCKHQNRGSVPWMTKTRWIRLWRLSWADHYSLSSSLTHFLLRLLMSESLRQSMKTCRRASLWLSSTSCLTQPMDRGIERNWSREFFNCLCAIKKSGLEEGKVQTKRAKGEKNPRWKEVICDYSVCRRLNWLGGTVSTTDWTWKFLR